jgi:hypothetical protein
MRWVALFLLPVGGNQMSNKYVELVEQSLTDCHHQEILDEGATSDTATLFMLGKLKRLQDELVKTQDTNAKIDLLMSSVIVSSSISVINGKSSKKSILGRLKKMVSVVI